ncbi:MAG: glucosyl-3-phosphoglycerate synthase [Acidimicrobiales bacterium]
MIDSYLHTDFPIALLLDRKGPTTISVCIPAHDEAETVAGVVSSIRRRLMRDARLVDDLLVIDDGSVDRTAAIAADCGARVIPASGAAPGEPIGKGGALRTAIEATDGDVIVFLDADVRDFDAHFVTGLLGPLLVDDRYVLSKATYERPCRGVDGEGGRVNAILARPLLRHCAPDLADLDQPLAGEYAVRRRALDGIELADGYGVEIGLLIDVAAAHSASAIAQVDLGTRIHRNRPLHQLGRHADDILTAALGRFSTHRAHEAPVCADVARPKV